MSETHADLLARVENMASGDPGEWVMSLIGRDALTAVLSERRELLAALKETRDAAASLIRVIYELDLVDIVMQSMPRKHDGFGKRANDLIARCEGQAEETTR